MQSVPLQTILRKGAELQGFTHNKEIREIQAGLVKANREAKEDGGPPKKKPKGDKSG